MRLLYVVLGEKLHFCGGWVYLQRDHLESIIPTLSGSDPHFTHVSGGVFVTAFLKGKVLAFLVFFG